jgi:hypothetical protein
MHAKTKFFGLAGATIAGALFFSGCGHSERGDAQAHAPSKPLAEFQLDSTAVASGTEIKIVGYAGANKNSKDTLNYSQFIGINEATEDTIRILTAYIAVAEEGATSNPVFVSPLMFNGAVREATFQIPDASQEILMKISPELEKEGSDPDLQKLGAIATDSVQQKYVVVRDNIRLFAVPRKTVAGILVFKQKPW